MKISVKLIDGKGFDVILNKDDNIENLKIKIEDVCGIPLCQQKLIFEGQVLKLDKEKVTACGLVSGSSVALAIYPREFKLRIHVKDDRILELLVKSNDNLLSVKNELEKLVPMHIDEQLLLYNGTELAENRLLSDYGIVDTCGMKLITKLRDKVNLTINLLNQKKVSLTVSSNRTISYIKSMLEEELNIPPADQQLMVNCRIIEDNETVSECFTNDKTPINLLCRSRMGFQIFVTTLNGDYFRVEVKKNEKVIDVKRKIKDLLRLETDKQKIIFQGKTLNDEEFIDKCGIEWNSSINLVSLNR